MRPETYAAIPRYGPQTLHHNTPHEISFESDEKVEGSVVNWCLSLGNISIRRMEMHSAHDNPSRFFVSFILDNNAVFAFERVTISGRSSSSSSSSKAPHDIITAVIEEAELWSNSIAMVEFPAGASEGLIFPLTICHRIQKTDWKDHRPNSQAFAWMLTALVARKQIPRIPIFASYPPTPLEELFSCVYSDLLLTGKSLWENDFRAEIQNMMQRQIFLALHEQFQTEPNADTTLDDHPLKRVVFSSLISWVKFLATHPDRNTLSIWDAAWDKAWNKEWGRAWDHEWGIQDDFIAGLKVGVGRIVMPKTVGAQASGRAAGRTPTDFKRVKEVITTEKTPAIAGNATLQMLGAGVRVNSRQSLKNINNVPKKMHARPRKDWLDEWCHIHYPDQGPAWRPAWQTAAEAAWVTMWRTAEELRVTRGQGAAAISATPPHRMAFRDAAKFVVALLPTKRQPQHSTATEERTKENKNLAETIMHGLGEEIVAPLADDALKRAEAVKTSNEANVVHMAEQIFNSTENSDDTLHMVKRLNEDIWVNVFVAAWRRTWKHSWMAAWLSVWDNIGKKALQSGIEDEDPLRHDPTINDAMSAAYNNILAMLCQTTQRTDDNKKATEISETGRAQTSSGPQKSATIPTTRPDIAHALQQAGLLFKELDHLNHHMSKHIPTPHKGCMKIKFTAGKTKQPIDHESLQRKYKTYLTNTVPKEHCQQHLREIAHVWETALRKVPKITVVNTNSGASILLNLTAEPSTDIEQNGNTDRSTTDPNINERAKTNSVASASARPGPSVIQPSTVVGNTV
ncbi:hypothetical protein BDV93DRAFT_609872 [Ceratobasidium sp. AG-I]|nr:hypothetical protein BDV93DRAFT_609872 [Ceratobasidium sp. AG-I]